MIKDKSSVTILGTKYIIERRSASDDIKLQEADGYCDTNSKLIVVRNTDDFKDDINTKSNLEITEMKVLRHELIHAFLYESGLCEQSYWAVNEEMIDYFAIQFPKIVKVMNDLTLL